MNNYKYYDTFNNQYNQNSNELYGAYEGYLKGNMFKNLYEQYKNYQPAILKPNNEKEQDLFNLNQMCFAMHDLNLYLDVYPNDEKVLNMLTKYKNMANELANNYEQKYGPITVNGSSNTIPFNWESTKFPWEVQ